MIISSCPMDAMRPCQEWFPQGGEGEGLGGLCSGEWEETEMANVDNSFKEFSSDGNQRNGDL